MDLIQILNKKKGGLSQPIDNNPRPEEEEFRIACMLLKDIYVSIDPKGKCPPKYYLSNADLEYAAKEVFQKYGLDMIKKFHDYNYSRGFFGKRDSWHSKCIMDDINSFIDWTFNTIPEENNETQNLSFNSRFYLDKQEKHVLTLPPFQAIFLAQSR